MTEKIITVRYKCSKCDKVYCTEVAAIKCENEHTSEYSHRQCNTCKEQELTFFDRENCRYCNDTKNGRSEWRPK